MRNWFASTLPRGLYGRAALIVLLPIVLIQMLVSVAFIQRHFEAVTWQMTDGVALEIDLVVRHIDEQGLPKAKELAQSLDLSLQINVLEPPLDLVSTWDIQGRNIAFAFRQRLQNASTIDLLTEPGRVRLWLSGQTPPLMVEMDRARVSASDPNQLLFLMALAGVFLGLLAMFFLRRQLSPIAHLAQAAESFGKGQIIPFRPRGALEVRAAGAAFLEMRNRIERQREQRTLLLSGISHDLRTPLTRLRLGLAILDDKDTSDLVQDVTEMERMLEEFLAFARGGATEAPQPTDPLALLETVVHRAARSGIEVTLLPSESTAPVMMRRDAITRAIENLINNAARYGDKAEASLISSSRGLRFVIEDDGPGIPPDQREEAMRPFTRLDPARDPNTGGGVGLGLAIVADLARSHGGQLRLSESARLGGLKAELIISR